MKKEIIIKFLNNQCTKEELDEIIRWANTESLNKESISWGYNDWKSFHVNDSLNDDEKFNILFDKIQQQIDIESLQNKNTEKEKRALTVFINWLTSVMIV